MNLEFLAEGFNLTNRTQVTNVNSTEYNLNFTTGIYTASSTFGQVTETGATLFRERQIQLAARFEF